MNWKPLNRNISNISCWHSVFYWYLRTLFFLTKFKQAFFKPQNKSLGRLLRPCSFTNDDAALTKDTFDDCYFWKTHVAYTVYSFSSVTPQKHSDHHLYSHQGLENVCSHYFLLSGSAICFQWSGLFIQNR